MTSARATLCRIGDWQANLTTGELSRAGGRAKLPPTDAVVLACLVARAGEVVSKAELLAAAWPRTHVADDAIWQSISRIRKALGDDQRQPRYLETLARRGYRIIAPVSVCTRSESAAPEEGVAAVAGGADPVPQELLARPIRRQTWALGIAAAIVVGVAWLFALASPSAESAPAMTLQANPAQDAYERARAYLERGGRADLEAAVLLATQSLEMNPDFAPAHAVLARSLSSQVDRWHGSLDDARTAVKHAERAAELAPGLYDTQVALAAAYRTAGTPGPGLAALSEPRSPAFGPDAARQEALLLFSRGRFAAALRIQSAYPFAGVDAVFGYDLRATVFSVLGRHELALEEVARGLSLAPANEKLLVLQSQLLSDLGRRDEAEAAIDILVRAHPGSGHAWSSAGYLARARGDLDDARRFLERSAEVATLRDANLMGLVRLAETLSAMGEGDLADATLDELESSCEYVLRQGRHVPYVLSVMAMARAVRGDAAGASKWLRDAIEAGYMNVRRLDFELAFAPVRSDPAFRSARAEMGMVAAREWRQIEATGTLGH
jgi:DNA-binding winged helix-turn-helix (wHTH) protein/Tfp pilus assembly protein PilF